MAGVKKSEAVPFPFVATKQSDDGTETQDILRWKGKKSTTKRGVEVRRRSALLELELNAETSFSLSLKRAEGQTQSSESLWADSSLNNKPFKLLCSACI